MLVSIIDPMIPQDMTLDREGADSLRDKATELIGADAYLAGRINSTVLEVMTQHMRLMNSYYSNRIEGNPTTLREIREAMKGVYSDEAEKKDFAKESIAHITVQDWLQENPVEKEDVYKIEFICSIHKQFMMQIPKGKRVVWNKDRTHSTPVIPGEIRETDADVGKHEAPSGDDLKYCLHRFEEAYDLTLGYKIKHIIGAVSSHHRLAWIHPFADGNGRTARLHIDEVFKKIGLKGIGIWCLSRGLARGGDDYKNKLAAADHLRKGDSDGRGSLSESELLNFCHYMIDTALDQISYMTMLFDIEGSDDRIRSYVKARQDKRILIDSNQTGFMPTLRDEAIPLLQKLFLVGEIKRSEVGSITGLKDKTLTNLVSQLKKEGLITTETHRSPIKWALPIHAEEYYFPKLAPKD